MSTQLRRLLAALTELELDPSLDIERSEQRYSQVLGFTLVPEASGRARDGLDNAFRLASMCPQSAPAAL